ncbi:unnamed protein product [Prorocentrum cordatum]|uniref:Uncharacterized protein n=1 Tax=Prorocentrum cordatum TaxID=2364126 RepID=A0ABN9PGS9_9DINO|nr:unnamed protein product [Polarella glacialis]
MSKEGHDQCLEYKSSAARTGHAMSASSATTSARWSRATEAAGGSADASGGAATAVRPSLCERWAGPPGQRAAARAPGPRPASAPPPEVEQWRSILACLWVRQGIRLRTFCHHLPK